ncbi:hypothetical protein DMENIID0001_030380 [Sergentomyia squamirostris]
MNFFKKVARDFQRPRNRRQSAPVLESEALKHRSKDYHQALSDFNERRRNRVSNSPFSIGRIREEGDTSISPMAGHSGLSGADKSSPSYADIEERSNEGRSSPPAGFFRMNSIPDLARSPRKSSTMPTKKNIVRNHGKGPAPPPPPSRFNPNGPLPRINKKTATLPNCLQNGIDTDQGSHASGAYRRYDLSSSNYDDDVPAAAEKPKTKKNGKKNGVRSPNKPNVIPKKYHRRQMSLVNENVFTGDAPPPKPARNSDFVNGQVHYDKVIDEGFKFLGDCYDITVNGSLNGAPVPVTDLDASDDHLKQDVKEEVPPDATQNTFDASIFDVFYTRCQEITKAQNVIMCWPTEISPRNPPPRTTIQTPLEYYSGVFDYVPVSVRKYTLGDGKDYDYAEMAIKRDFEIINIVRHPNLALLMAVNLDRGLNQINLVMEGFDFSLNHFLYKINPELSVLETIHIVEQLASAVLYVHGKQIVHSNISSHTVMVSLHPFYGVTAKLTSFELATSTKYKQMKEVLVQTYGKQGYYNQYDGFTVMGQRGQAPPNVPESVDREELSKLSREIVTRKIVPSVLAKRLDFVDPKHMPYFQSYRQKFSLHNYQAPELVKAKANFVLPRPQSDVYSLTILLWEMLNHCIPLVMYSYEQVEAIHDINSARRFLSIINGDRCKFFDEIFSRGLEPTPKDRLPMSHFSSFLEEVRCSLKDQANKVDEAKPDVPRKYPNLDSIKSDKYLHKEFFNVIGDSGQKEVLNQGGYFSDGNLQHFDNRIDHDGPAKSVTKADSCLDELLDVDFKNRNERNASHQRTNGELSNMLSFASLGKSHGGNLTDNASRRRMSILTSQLYDEKPNHPLFNLSQSTIFPSSSDFHNKLLASAKEGDRLERTSTTKKKKQRDFQRASDIFAPTKSRRNLDDKLATEMESSAERSDEAVEAAMTSGLVEKAKARLKKCVLNGSRNCSSDEEEEEVAQVQQEEKIVEVKNFSPGKYTFNVGTCELPKASIAKKNKLRRYAWLSEKKPTVSPNGSSFNFSSGNSGSNLFREGVMFPQNFKLAKHLEKNPNGSVCSTEASRGSSLNNSFRKLNLKVKHNDHEIFSSESSFANDENFEKNISKKISEVHLDLFHSNSGQEKDLLKGGVNPKIEVKVSGRRNGEDCEIRSALVNLSAQIVKHFDDKSEHDETTERSDFEKDSRRMMILSPEQVAMRRQKNKSNREDVQRFQTSLWHRERSICEKTSYNGTLGDDTVDDDEDGENCPHVANRRTNGINLSSGGEATKYETDDFYLDDDLSLYPALSVNIDLEFP